MHFLQSLWLCAACLPAAAHSSGRLLAGWA